jgi:hypothetical protein
MSMLHPSSKSSSQDRLLFTIWRCCTSNNNQISMSLKKNPSIKANICRYYLQISADITFKCLYEFLNSPVAQTSWNPLSLSLLHIKSATFVVSWELTDKDTCQKDAESEAPLIFLYFGNPSVNDNVESLNEPVFKQDSVTRAHFGHRRHHFY